MERRLLLVFALTFLIVMLSQPLLKKYAPKTVEPAPQQQQAQNTPAAQPASAPASSPAAPPVAGAKQASSETETTVENDLYRIRFTNRGGQVKSWVLKKFTDDKGQPLELVNDVAAQKFGYPLSLWSYDETLRNKLNSVLYVQDGGGRGTLTAPAEISFEYSDGDTAARNTFSFEHSYEVTV